MHCSSAGLYALLRETYTTFDDTSFKELLNSSQSICHYNWSMIAKSSYFLLQKPTKNLFLLKTSSDTVYYTSS